MCDRYLYNFLRLFNHINIVIASSVWILHRLTRLALGIIRAPVIIHLCIELCSSFLGPGTRPRTFSGRSLAPLSWSTTSPTILTRYISVNVIWRRLTCVASSFSGRCPWSPSGIVSRGVLSVHLFRWTLAPSSATTDWGLYTIKETSGILGAIEWVFSACRAWRKRENGQSDGLTFCIRTVKLFDCCSCIGNVIVGDKSCTI